jgi:hypothetical protein
LGELSHNGLIGQALARSALGLGRRLFQRGGISGKGWCFSPQVQTDLLVHHLGSTLACHLAGGSRSLFSRRFDIHDSLFGGLGLAGSTRLGLGRRLGA